MSGSYLDSYLGSRSDFVFGFGFVIGRIEIFGSGMVYIWVVFGIWVGVWVSV